MNKVALSEHKTPYDNERNYRVMGFCMRMALAVIEVERKVGREPLNVTQYLQLQLAQGNLVHAAACMEILNSMPQEKTFDFLSFEKFSSAFKQEHQRLPAPSEIWSQARNASLTFNRV